VNLEQMAKESKDYVGADIEAVCREAAMLAIREYITPDMSPEEARKNAGTIQIRMKHFQDALKKVRPTVSRDVAQRYERLTEEFARQVVGGYEEQPKEEKKPEEKAPSKEKATKEKKPAEIRTAS
jgi:transitional endoplasmic reticulum ATPase